MNFNTDLIKTIVSYNIDNVDFKNNVYINVEKNKEKLTLVLPRMTSYVDFCKGIYLQNEYGVMNKPTDKQLLSTMFERNCNWLLTDNNLNFIQCFTDSQYYPVCMDSKQSFLRDKERWGIGEIEEGKLKLIHAFGREKHFDFVEHSFCDFSYEKNEKFTERVFLLKGNTVWSDIYKRSETFYSKLEEFVFVEKGRIRNLYHSELIYLFHKSVKNELSLHTIFNKSLFYGK